MGSLRLLLGSLAVLSFSVATAGEVKRSIIPGQVLVGLKAGAMESVSFSALDSLSWPSGFGEVSAKNTKVLLNNAKRGVLVFRQNVETDSVESMVSHLKTRSHVAWAAPNYRYEGPLLDTVDRETNDPQVGEQYHHVNMKNFEAWEQGFGRNQIIAAVTDTGMDYEHEDLKANMWKNINEIPDNEIDDDENGLVDDYHGWDFADDDNDPINPWASESHATHVGGIIAATPNNELGVAGVAGGIQLMPVRMLSWSVSSSEIFLNSYKYAIDNGATLINTSIRVDGLVEDEAYREGTRYVYDNGGMVFNSAGNADEYRSKRVAVTEIMLVCSTDKEDKKSDFSNYGEGVDLCAPGSDVLSTVPDDKYDEKSGTSMAAPNALASAALIWSRNPGWTRDQVIAQLLGTTDSIDELNPDLEGKLGAGRINNLNALTMEARLSAIKGLVELREGLEITAPEKLTVEFTGVFDPGTVNLMENWSLVNVATQEEVEMTLPKEYFVATNWLEFEFAEALPAGEYRFQASGTGLLDPFGRMGAQEGSTDTLLDVTFTVLQEEFLRIDKPLLGLL